MRNKNKKTNSRFVLRTNGLLLGCLVLFYLLNLVVANHAANQRYAGAQFRHEYEGLQSEKQDLSVQVAGLQSLERLNTESARLQLVKADTIHYVVIKGAVALNN